MKIISKFSDYYDIGLAYGIDKKLWFKRNTQCINYVGEGTREPVFIKYNKNGSNFRMTFLFNLIGFCGNIYPFVEVLVDEVIKKNKNISYSNISKDIYYSLEEIDNFIQEDLKLIREKNEFQFFRYYVWNKIDFDKLIKNFFSKKYTSQKLLFKKEKVPYFIIKQNLVIDSRKKETYGYSLKLLPILKSYKFVKVFSPMKAFQEISMYLGALDLEEDNTIKIEDKYLAKSKGFDCYSFKKTPSKKKIKKC